ncbi:MAG: hypothetical protein IPK76_18970 [Lewinellaceae bacterium]|nr:hypothetical protein [Lewinellaceae bacterium]
MPYPAAIGQACPYTRQFRRNIGGNRRGKAVLAGRPGVLQPCLFHVQSRELYGWQGNVRQKGPGFGQQGERLAAVADLRSGQKRR